jgi:cytoskeletal protein CcmA (bactofilin family)
MFGKPQRPPDPPAPPEPPPTRRFTDRAAPAKTVVARGIVIRGEIRGEDSVDLAGTLEGDAAIGGLLHISETASLVGTVSAQDVVVEGSVAGRIAARGKVEMRHVAKVRADVQAGTIAIAEGCLFEGHVRMDGEAGPGGQVASFRERRRSGEEAAHPGRT